MTDDARLTGRAFRAHEARPIPARLVRRAGRVTVSEVETGTVLADIPAPDLRFDAPLGRAPRRATLPDGMLFETEDHEGVEALTGPDAGTMLHRLERLHPRMILFVAFCLAIGWAIWRWGLDILVAGAIAMTPATVVQAIDAGTLAALDRTLAEPSDLPVTTRAEAEAVFAAMVAAIPADLREDRHLRLEFRSVPGVGPNAFALPGGTVVVTDALLTLFPDADVRAGVFGHELGHVIEDHGLRRLYRSLGTYVLIALLVGDTGPILEDIVLEGNVLLSLAYSRADESAADRFGVSLARDAGYDPAGLLDFFGWLADRGGEVPAWASSHPSHADRLDEIRRQIDGD